MTVRFFDWDPIEVAGMNFALHVAPGFLSLKWFLINLEKHRILFLISQFLLYKTQFPSHT